MAKRSTRQKIRDSAKTAITQIDDIYSRFAHMQDLAQDRSDPINEYIPILVQYLEMVKEIMVRFRELL